MKMNFDGVIVVEGSNDASYISSFVNCPIVITNGYELIKEEMDFLSHVIQFHNVYILTDSDGAGEKIRSRLLQFLPSAINLRVSLDKCNKKSNKHGVAECEKEEIIRVLKDYCGKYNQNNRVSMSDLYALNLIGNGSKENRNRIANCFHLGRCNGKTLLQRINYLNINKEDLEKC